MTKNVMQEYIKITQEEIIAYMKLIFEKSYNKKITLRYLDAYMNVRFFNFYKKDEKLTFRKNFLNALKEEEEKILKDIPQKRKLIENIGLFFYYILYFDKISYKTDIEETINKLYKMRKKILKKDNEDFKENFYNTFKTYLNKKEEFLNQFNTEEFYLKITAYEGISNTNKVILKHNVKFPMIYSSQAIENVFNTGLIQEDKLFVEYSMISTQVILDIQKGNFKKQYIIEFAGTLFNKTKKIKSLLNIINNSAIQDKVSLKITYKEFLKNKEEVYQLMREGFRFAVILDNSFEPEYVNFKKLNVFNYTIVSKQLNCYEQVLLNEEKINNLIRI
ncbi:MAG: hypothetical protein ACI4VQ_05610 [Clostridia bacterium]